MRVLALEPYYGGSHRAFIDGWIARSRHDWTLLTLPAHKWKWRMRHSAATFARTVRSLPRNRSFDIVLCSDMLNLAEFKGLAGADIARLPSVAYFHENQLTYPVQVSEERDLHFAMTNLITASAADRIWFNSKYHRASFLEAADEFIMRMPDNQGAVSLSALTSKSTVAYPGIEPFETGRQTLSDPPVILWTARWEHDKNPELFFEALSQLSRSGHDFRVSVLGERFRDVPEVFERARARLGDRIVRWGFEPSREAYRQVLLDADIVVSTAQHEFFGLAVMEAVAAGCVPLLPDRLAYPELFRDSKTGGSDEFFYDGTVDSLVDSLERLLTGREELRALKNSLCMDSNPADRFLSEKRVPELDSELKSLVSPDGS